MTTKPSAPGPRRRPLALILALVIGLVVTASLMGGAQSPGTRGSYTQLVRDIDAHRVVAARLDPQGGTVRVTLSGGRRYSTGVPESADAQLLDRLTRAGVADVVVEGVRQRSPLLALLLFLLPPALLVLVFVWFARRARGGATGLTSFGRSRARRADLSPGLARVTFSDVAGADEAVEELQEIKEFLADPGRFLALGARIPKGVLLYGPPGTGKTLLARAVAGEAGVPFFSISGSDFVEMFVGVGASRVRDLFAQARASAPCIVFVDEIDAVGRHRGTGLGGGHDEREQTLNQLLVELDGFEAGAGVIVIAATNRPDVLDPALLRPGRFDRQIAVEPPDRAGRLQILAVHARGKPIGELVELDTLAAQTPGFSGADLANVVNEAALLAARRGAATIGGRELDEAVLRVIAGPARKARLLSERERLVTAYHELGHALVGHFLEHADPVHKVSIVSRGRALGYTISLPAEDTFLTTRAKLLDTMAMTLGGRAAEELVFGQPTSGASNDLEKVTAIAKQMVMRLRMSDRLGPRVFGYDHAQPFLGRELGTEPGYSDEVAREIDHEIRHLVAAARERASELLGEHRAALDRLSEVLVRRETLEAHEFESLLGGASEEDVFGSHAPLPSPPGVAPAPAGGARHKPPLGLPRPGFAGGAAMTKNE